MLSRPVCRFQRGDRCDSDAECVDCHGDGSLCFQNYCESTNPDAVAACDDESHGTMRASCRPPWHPTHFNDDRGLIKAYAFADGECTVTVGQVGACRGCPGPLLLFACGRRQGALPSRLVPRCNRNPCSVRPDDPLQGLA